MSSVIEGAPPSRRPAPLLEVRDLKTYFLTPRGTVRAVDGVTLTLERGTTLGVVGESGSGKTMLSRSIMGLLPEAQRRREGSVQFEGIEISTMSLRRAPHLGPRDGDDLPGPDDVAQPGDEDRQADHRVAEGAPRHVERRRREQRRRSCSPTSASPSPTRRLDEYPHQLSGGMRQRVTIAIALACGPTLLFADEPTTALDVTVQAQILDLLAEQQRDRNMSMILVTHDLGVVAGRTDEIAVMYAGKIVERAPTTHAVRQHEDAVHRGAAEEHPEDRGPQPHPARDHRRAGRPT